MKLLEVVTSPSIYHSWSTWKKFCEGKFTIVQFTPVNMKNFGCRDVRKHMYIKNSENYITLDILLKFGSLD